MSPKNELPLSVYIALRRIVPLGQTSKHLASVLKGILMMPRRGPLETGLIFQQGGVHVVLYRHIGPALFHPRLRGPIRVVCILQVLRASPDGHS